MAASVDIIINAIDKTKGAINSSLREIGKAEIANRRQNQDLIMGQEKVKRAIGDVTGAFAMAAGSFYAANAALDNVQKRFEELGMKDQANEIERSQQAWQALADTLLVISGSDVVSGISQISLSAAEAARQLFLLTSLNENNLVKSFMNVLFPIVGITNGMRDAYNLTNGVDRKAKDLETLTKAQETKQASIAASNKKQNEELQKQLDKYNQINDALQEGIRRRDPAAIRKAESDMTKLNAENPNAVALGKSGVTVVINGGGMKDVVTGVIVNGIQQEPNYLDPTRGY